MFVDNGISTAADEINTKKVHFFVFENLEYFHSVNFINLVLVESKEALDMHPDSNSFFKDGSLANAGTNSSGFVIGTLSLSFMGRFITVLIDNVLRVDFLRTSAMGRSSEAFSVSDAMISLLLLIDVLRAPASRNSVDIDFVVGLRVGHVIDGAF